MQKECEGCFLDDMYLGRRRIARHSDAPNPSMTCDSWLWFCRREPKPPFDRHLSDKARAEGRVQAPNWLGGKVANVKKRDPFLNFKEYLVIYPSLVRGSDKQMNRPISCWLACL